MRYDNEKLSLEYERTAWQSAMLMNATGNFKKTIKATDLYERPGAKKEKAEKPRMTREDQNRKLDELKSKFGRNEG